tara:strand:+ start:359 stop:1261 length:903 start_codon:yes stop_codon:yes gene_type:complete
MTEKQAHIVEVGPRDGLQYEQPVPLQAKIRLIEQLIEAGVRYIEAGSFVSPKRVPQMADTAEVLNQLKRHDQVTYCTLTPNLKGLELAQAHQVKEIAVFASASEDFSQRNLNCSIAESIAQFTEVIHQAKAYGMQVRGYVSCVLGCPHEGRIEPQQVIDVAKQLYDQGCYQISLGDTIGVGTANQARQLVQSLSSVIPVTDLALHFHDTYGQALSNICACLDLGVRTFDSSVAGLGGCPFAEGASGNLATEDLVYCLEGQGLSTGLNLHQLIQAGDAICQVLQKRNQSKVAQALRHKINI